MKTLYVVLRGEITEFKEFKLTKTGASIYRDSKYWKHIKQRFEYKHDFATDYHTVFLTTDQKLASEAQVEQLVILEQAHKRLARHAAGDADAINKAYADKIRRVR